MIDRCFSALGFDWNRIRSERRANSPARIRPIEIGQDRISLPQLPSEAILALALTLHSADRLPRNPSDRVVVEQLK